MTREANYRELSAVPAELSRPVWQGEGVKRRLVNDADPFKWSGDNDPPALGAKVKIYMNALGTGTVVGYFVEYGWFGVLVKLNKAPAWWRKQNPSNRPAHLFGLDLEPRRQVKP
jgi:hypothetical protein